MDRTLSHQPKRIFGSAGFSRQGRGAAPHGVRFWTDPCPPASLACPVGGPTSVGRDKPSPPGLPGSAGFSRLGCGAAPHGVHGLTAPPPQAGTPVPPPTGASPSPLAGRAGEGARAARGSCGVHGLRRHGCRRSQERPSAQGSGVGVPPPLPLVPLLLSKIATGHPSGPLTDAPPTGRRRTRRPRSARTSAARRCPQRHRTHASTRPRACPGAA